MLLLRCWAVGTAALPSLRLLCIVQRLCAHLLPPHAAAMRDEELAQHILTPLVRGRRRKASPLNATTLITPERSLLLHGRCLLGCPPPFSAFPLAFPCPPALTPTPTPFPPLPSLQRTTYKAPFTCDLVYQVEGMPEQRLSKRLGGLPVMLKSKACYLRNMTRRELVARKVGGAGGGGGPRQPATPRHGASA